MRRVQYRKDVIADSGACSNVLISIKRANGTTPPVYQFATGINLLANPGTTNKYGSFVCYLDSGSYVITVTDQQAPARFASYTETFEALVGAGNSIAGWQVEHEGITDAKLANNAVTNLKPSFGTLTDQKLVDSSIGTSKIQDASVNMSQITGVSEWDHIRVRREANTSIANGGIYVVAWDTIDAGSVTPGATSITIPQTGTYALSGHAAWSITTGNGVGNYAQCYVVLEGTWVIAQNISEFTDGVQTMNQIAHTRRFTAGDEIELVANQGNTDGFSKWLDHASLQLQMVSE